MNQAEPPTKIYQLAGVDEQERGFNRQGTIYCRNDRYQAVLRYETLYLEERCQDTEAMALQALIHTLHERRYTYMRTQLIFRGGHYLGSQEPWVDYPDPESVLPLFCGLKRWMKGWFPSRIGE